MLTTTMAIVLILVFVRIVKIKVCFSYPRRVGTSFFEKIELQGWGLQNLGGDILSIITMITSITNCY